MVPSRRAGRPLGFPFVGAQFTGHDPGHEPDYVFGSPYVLRPLRTGRSVRLSLPPGPATGPRHRARAPLCGPP